MPLSSDKLETTVCWYVWDLFWDAASWSGCYRPQKKGFSSVSSGVPTTYQCHLWAAIHRSPLWGSLRAGAQPMFHSENLSAYAGTINKAVDELITNLSTVAKSGKEVNIFTQLGQMTMQVTGAAAFG